MRALGTFPALTSPRNPLVAFVGFTFVFLLAYESAQIILTGQVSLFAYAAIACVGFAVIVVILNDWHRGIYIFFAWILFEDFCRKYLGNNMAVYFTKDALILVLFLSYFRARRLSRADLFRPPFLVPLLLLFWFGVIQVFNPASTSFFYGLLGIKLYFLYIPLMYLGYAFVESEEQLRRFFVFNSFLILIIAGLGLAQSVIGPSFLNPAVLQSDIRNLSSAYRVSPITGAIAYRPTSVFVSAGRFQDFLIVSWLAALGFGGYVLLRTRRHRNLAFCAIAAIAAGSLMSTSRGVFMWNAGSGMVVLAAFLWGAPWRQGEALRVVRAIQRSLLGIGLAVLLLTAAFPQQLGSRLAVYSETLSPASPASELVFRAHDYPLRNFLGAFSYPRWPYGYGIGTCSLGIQYVIRITHAAYMNIGVESGWGLLVLELGFFGLLLWFFLGLAVAFSARGVVLQLRGTPWFPIGFVILWYATLLFFPMSYVGLAYQDFVMNAYLWFLLGVLFRLPHFVQLARLQQTLGKG